MSAARRTWPMPRRCWTWKKARGRTTGAQSDPLRRAKGRLSRCTAGVPADRSRTGAGRNPPAAGAGVQHRPARGQGIESPDDGFVGDGDEVAPSPAELGEERRQTPAAARAGFSAGARKSRPRDSRASMAGPNSALRSARRRPSQSPKLISTSLGIDGSIAMAEKGRGSRARASGLVTQAKPAVSAGRRQPITVALPSGDRGMSVRPCSGAPWSKPSGRGAAWQAGARVPIPAFGARWPGTRCSHGFQSVAKNARGRNDVVKPDRPVEGSLAHGGSARGLVDGTASASPAPGIPGGAAIR